MKSYYWLISLKVSKKRTTKLVFKNLEQIATMFGFSLRYIQKLIKINQWDTVPFQIEKIPAKQVLRQPLQVIQPLQILQYPISS